jgi:hypothetical protein
LQQILEDRYAVPSSPPCDRPLRYRILLSQGKIQPFANCKAPLVWNWATWFLSNPNSYSLYWKNLLLVLVAYFSQFLIILFFISLVITLLRHNLFFLNAIFLRSRTQGQDPDSFIVLKLDDVNQRLGLTTLSAQFKEQIKLLSIAAGFTLTSRWVNSDRETLPAYLTKISWDELYDLKRILPSILKHAGHPFLTTGQVMFPVMWLIMFLVVMLPAGAKWLPLRRADRIGGGAVEFLRDLLVPGNQNETMANTEDVNRVAKSFASQAFWPSGNGNAELLSIGAFFFFFILLLPILPTTRRDFTYLFFVLVLAFGCSKALFAVFRYRLQQFDKRLVDAQDSDGGRPPE